MKRMRRNLLTASIVAAVIALAVTFVHSKSQKAAQQEQQSQSAPKISTERPLEWPAIDKSDDIIQHIGYTTAYNHTTLTPNWVAYELTKSEADGDLPRNDAFAQDQACKGRQADLSDYRGSGWDRGHMAPAADMKWSDQAMLESFLLTNMCPQDHECNAGVWERTERMGRRIAGQYGSVHIVCGPVYKSTKYRTIGANQVAIPDAFFKAFLIQADGTYSAIGFYVANTDERQELKATTLTVDELEKIIHRDLFPALPDDIEKEIEAKIMKKHWGI